MNGVSLTLAPNIKAFAKAHEITFSATEIANLSDTLSSLAQIDADNQVSFILGQGRTGTIDDALEIYSAGLGKPAQTIESDFAIRPGMNATERAVAVNAAAKAGSDVLKQKQALDLAQTYGNPWKTMNKTHQAYIINTNPVLAKQLKSQAGVR